MPGRDSNPDFSPKPRRRCLHYQKVLLRGEINFSPGNVHITPGAKVQCFIGEQRERGF